MAMLDFQLFAHYKSFQIADSMADASCSFYIPRRC